MERTFNRRPESRLSLLRSTRWDTAHLDRLLVSPDLKDVLFADVRLSKVLFGLEKLQMLRKDFCNLPTVVDGCRTTSQVSFSGARRGDRHGAAAIELFMVLCKIAEEKARAFLPFDEATSTQGCGEAPRSDARLSLEARDGLGVSSQLEPS